MSKRKNNQKVHVNKYANINGLGNNEMVKYRSILEELCCDRVSLNGIPKQNDLDNGKIPSRSDFNYLKQKYREYRTN